MTRLPFFAVGLFMLMLTGICLAQDTGAQQDTGARRGRSQHGRGGAMMRMDTNNDGKISREEWKGKPEEFDKIDKNGDGFITKEELAESRRNRFEEMDTNNDGKISRDEWKG
ncbi:MAG: EF-hand domain-containing protein, partial [Blastocatellia bacterium]|nr:EF-hand domain-containing protein [Blastocatellia bacterium]